MSELDELAENLSEDEIQARKEQLKEDTKQEYQAKQESKKELIDAVSQDDSVGNFAHAELGDVEVKHKLWIPGDQLQDVSPDMNKKEIANVFSGVESITEIMTDISVEVRYPEKEIITTDEEAIQDFWEGFLNTFGTDAMVLAAEEILMPVIEEMEEKSEGLQSFQGERGDGFRDGVERDRLNPE